MFSTMMPLYLIIFFYLQIIYVYGASKSKPHSHSGVIPAFNGSHLSYDLSPEQEKKLSDGLPVIIKDSSTVGNGRGIVLQDIHADPLTVLEVIANLPNYQNVVPNVKSVEVYESEVNDQAPSTYGAKFNVGVGILRFSYFLKLIKNPQLLTFYWTLDYRYSSDFDDNTGQWQVLPHPQKQDWSRVVYATDVKLYSWIPSFVISFLTNTALVESTTWVKKSSEATPAHESFILSDRFKNCFSFSESGSSYDGRCGSAALTSLHSDAFSNADISTPELKDSDPSHVEQTSLETTEL